MEFLLLASLIGLIPGFIARSKGYDFGHWWLYGFLLFIVAFPHSILLKRNACRFCGETIKRGARVCRHCHREQVERYERAVSKDEFCQHCGHLLAGGAYCQGCGKLISPTNAQAVAQIPEVARPAPTQTTVIRQQAVTVQKNFTILWITVGAVSLLLFVVMLLSVADSAPSQKAQKVSAPTLTITPTRSYREGQNAVFRGRVTESEMRPKTLSPVFEWLHDVRLAGADGFRVKCRTIESPVLGSTVTAHGTVESWGSTSGSLGSCTFMGP